MAQERSRTAPPPDFPALADIPAGRYTDPGFFAQARRGLWQRCWLYAAHVDQLPQAGSYVQWQHGSAPIVLLRGDDMQVRAFYNTCRHRGAPVVRDPAGQAPRTLVCGYHGWRYRRDGTLEAVSEARDWDAPDLACRGLVPVRCEQYGNWFFVCEDPGAESLAEFLAPLSPWLAHLALDELRLVSRREIVVASNVSVLIENFLEAYHFNLLHPRTTHRIFDNRGTSIHLWRNGHSMMLSPHRRADWVDPGTVGMPEMSGSSEIERDFNPSYCLFPNLILPIAPSGIPAVALWPLTVRTSILEILWFAPRWEGAQRPALWDTRISNFDRIVDEDIQFAEPMQRTIESPGFLGVPLSYQERRIYHWHEEVDRRIDLSHVPPDLRVPAVLGAWVE